MKSGSFIIVDGKEWSSRHNGVKTAEQLRNQIIADEVERLMSSITPFPPTGCAGMAC